MCKCFSGCPLKKYISEGRGIGLKVVTLFSLLVSFVVAICSPLLIISTLEQNGLDEAIEKIPVITIENGKIVDPIFNNETLIFPADPNTDEADRRIVINTIIDDIQTIPEDVEVYVTARNIYMNKKSEKQIISIPENLNTVLTHKLLKTYIEQLIWFGCILLCILMLIASIIFFLFLYLPTIIIGLIVNKDLTVDAWGRALAWPFSIMWGIIVINGLFAITTIPISFVIIIPLLATWIIGISSTICGNERTENSNIVDKKNETSAVSSSEDVSPTPSSEPLTTKPPVSLSSPKKKKAVVRKKEVKTIAKKEPAKSKKTTVQRKKEK